MEYIILDLEWNQSPNGKGKENKNLPFEIVEIGAVKLDADRQYVDKFHRIIAPKVYHELHRVTRDLIHLSMDDLRKGIPFQSAVKEFFEWCGTEGEYVFGTWGTMDLTELQRNCRFYRINYTFPKPFIYYDIQKLYSLCYDDGKSRLALQSAIEDFNLDIDEAFHSAEADAIYTARIFSKMDFDKVSEYSSIDTFVIPANRKEEFTINYGTYSKYVSHGYTDKDVLMKDSVILSSKCYKCGKNVRKKIRWFSTNQKMYYCLAWCDTHGYIKGKMKIRKADNELFYATKIMKITDEEGAAKIKQKQLAARAKRRERRHKEKLHD